jgi:signal transduction histidine kinase
VLAEAVRNAHKHSRPTRVGVRTARTEDTFVPQITNDGVKADSNPHPGMGLRLASFEALQAGGLVEFGNRGDEGWQVRLVVPQDGKR